METSSGPAGDDNPAGSKQQSRVRIPVAEGARVPQRRSSTEGKSILTVLLTVARERETG